jgi:hypothetical protein
MSRTASFYKILAATAVALLCLLILTPAAAQSELPPPDTKCKNCHENLYYLYDTGRWYCQCAMRANCTSCHGGDATQTDETLAHQGMVANPATDNPAACQSCHPQDYAEKIEKFLAVSGVHATKKPLPSPELVSYIDSPSNGKLAIPAKSPAEFQPWRAAGVLAGILLVAALGFALCRMKCARSTGGLE